MTAEVIIRHNFLKTDCRINIKTPLADKSSWKNELSIAKIWPELVKWIWRSHNLISLAPTLDKTVFFHVSPSLSEYFFVIGTKFIKLWLCGSHNQTIFKPNCRIIIETPWLTKPAERMNWAWLKSGKSWKNGFDKVINWWNWCLSLKKLRCSTYLHLYLSIFCHW